MDSPPRFLLIGSPTAPPPGLDGHPSVVADNAAAAAALIGSGEISTVVADPATLSKVFSDLARDEMVLAYMDKGVAILDPAGAVVWANPAFEKWLGGDAVGQTLMAALGPGSVAASSSDPLALARAGTPTTFRVHRFLDHVDQYTDLSVDPVADRDSGAITHLVVFTRNVTAEVEQQKKLDALHQGGRELAGLDLSLLAEMNLPTRVELLKQNLRRFIHDLLHYDIIELRLLDRRTGELKPLLEDGMTPEAANRVLYADRNGNGVTGYVAATGRSYLCTDTASDPLYLQGAAGARSSLTVPISFADEVVGTLNFESPRPNAFGPDDLQFTELFTKEVAAALHTLDLLSAQQVCTAAQSIDAVNREIALPIDDLMAAAALLLARIGPNDSDAATQLRKVLAGAREVKASVRKVGNELAGADVHLPAGEQPLVGQRVLVVDADERSRRQAHLLLGRLGSAVETAGTAIEGIALAGDAGYDAILMDIKPPDLGGYETYRRLRAACPRAKIAMTTGFGYDSAHSIVKARADGMKHVLFKPFRQDQVVKAVLDDGSGVMPALTQSGHVSLTLGRP